MINQIERFVFTVVKLINKAGLGILFIMMLLTVADVVGRYFFNFPIAGAFELTEVMLSLLVFFSIAYTQVNKGHISIDIIISRLSPMKKVIMDTIMYFICLILAILLTWQLGVHAKRLWVGGNVSGVLEIPYYPFVILITFGSALFCLVLIFDFLHSLAKVLRHEF